MDAPTCTNRVRQRKGRKGKESTAQINRRSGEGGGGLRRNSKDSAGVSARRVNSGKREKGNSALLEWRREQWKDRPVGCGRKNIKIKDMNHRKN